MGCVRECKEKHETTMYGWGLGVGLAVARPQYWRIHGKENEQ